MRRTSQRRTRLNSHNHIDAASFHLQFTRHDSTVISASRNGRQQLRISRRSSSNGKFRRACAELSTFKRFALRFWLTSASTKSVERLRSKLEKTKPEMMLKNGEFGADGTPPNLLPPSQRNPQPKCDI